MIVTTSGRPNETLIKFAKNIAQELGVIYSDRNKQAVNELKLKFNDNILVVGKNRLELHFTDMKDPLFFHPNSAMFRIKRLIKGEPDPFLNACQLKEGDAFLDCTLGLASDSIVASYIVGNNGRVTGIEERDHLAYIVKTGLKQWTTGLSKLDIAMNRIEVVGQDHLTYLRNLPDRSYSVVYFDPMFEETIEGSVGILPLKKLANFSPLKSEAIEEAKRVAKKRIVLKDHWKSSQFKKHGFEVEIRKSAKFHYGVIDLTK